MSATLAWLDTKKVLTPERVNDDLRLVLPRRFTKALVLARLRSDEWLVSYPSRPVFGVSVTLSKRGCRLCFQRGGTDWSAWLLSVLRSELGALYDGECGDEGADLTWTPDPKKWPNYETFIRNTHRRMISRGDHTIVQTLLNDVPEALR